MRRLTAPARHLGALATVALLTVPLAAAWPAAAATDPAAAIQATADACAAPTAAVALRSGAGAAARPVRVTAVAVRFQSATNARLAAVVRAKASTGKGFVVVLRMRPVGSRAWKDRRVTLRSAKTFGVAVFPLKGLKSGARYEFRLYASKGTKRSVVSTGRFKVPATGGGTTPVAPTDPGATGDKGGAATIAPTVTILSPTPTSTTIVLRANVNPKGSATQAWFEFGYYPTVNSSHSTPARNMGAGSTNVLLQDKLTGLKGSRIHYYRVMTKSGNVTRAGITCSVKTLADGTAPTPTPTPAPAPAPTPAPATADLYVSTSGNDANDGSSARPWRTLSKAIASAPAGKVVGIRAGTYDGFVINRSGAEGAPITLMGLEPGVIVRATSARPNAIEIQGQHDIRLLKMTMTGGLNRYNAGVKILDGSRNIEIADSTLTANHSFGIDSNGSTNIFIRRNTITNNDTGIRINRSGAGTVIEDNQVNDNNSMVINDSAPGTDSGASGIVFLHTTGASLARRNTLHGNRAKSIDYGYDGSAFEIYGASNVTMSENVIYDNQTVLETGTSGTPCNDNVFIRNLSWGGNNKSIVTVSGAQVNGIHLRCATRMLIANNVFDDMDYWVYDINQSSGFSASIDGFKIINNVHYQRSHKVYGIVATLPSNAVIDNNVSWTTGGALADVSGKGSARTADQFRQMTGKGANEVFADPLFVNLGGHDYHLQAGSPAIDRGRTLPGVTDGFLGAAPDSGRYETR